MDYLLQVNTPGYIISNDKFSIDSAFAEHLRVLRKKTQERFDRLVIAAPYMEESQYKASKNNSVIVDSNEGIVFLPLFHNKIHTVKFWFFHAVRIVRILYRQIHRSDLVHTGLSYNIWKPTGLMTTMCAVIQKKKTVWVVDIDYRRSAWMLYKSGKLSLKSFLLNRYIYDTVRSFQVRYAVENCSLVLLKSLRMAQHFGKGRPNVHNFFDAVHSDDILLNQKELNDRTKRVLHDKQPLKLVYFGRIVEYKGIDASILAVDRARKISGRSFVFHIIGAGDKKRSLQEMAKNLDAFSAIFFHDAVPYGPSLFNKIKEYDICLATPISEDTPRSAFDAMAVGLPILAYDTFYYQDLREIADAVEVVSWSRTEELACRIVELDNNRERIVAMIENAVAFARKNTQQIWIERRLAWTWSAIKDSPPPP